MPETADVPPDVLEAKSAMQTLIAERADAPNMAVEDPAAYRLLNDKITGHATTLAQHEADLQEARDAADVERLLSDEPPPLDATGQAVLAARRVEAAEELDLLADLGFEGTDDLDLENISEWGLAALKMQRFAAQRDYDGLVPLIEKEMQALQTTPESLAMFRQFAGANLDPDLKDAVAAEIVAWLYAAHAPPDPEPDTEPDTE